MNPTQPSCAIGIDCGGTKCAAGLVVLADGKVIAHRILPTVPLDGGEAVLATVIELAQSMRDFANANRWAPGSIGLGVAELVDRAGTVVSNATIDWRGIDVAAQIAAATGLPVCIDADVRAAARAEARFGAGSGLNNLLYVTVGTGISAALVVDGCPYRGARGLTGTFASTSGLVPNLEGRLVSSLPLESYSAGPSLAARMRMTRPDFEGSAVEVIALAESGDPSATAIVESGGRSLGSAMALLVNVLDPAVIVLGGGLGLAGGLYRKSLELALRDGIYSDGHRDVPLRSASLGVDAGVIGAALTAE